MYDLVILGAGPGGYAAALYAHNFELSVALVERDRPGGTCLLRGCIPAKQWLQIAEVYTTVRHAAEFGVLTSEPQLDWQAGLNRKQQTVEGLVRGLGALLKQRKVEVVTGRGPIRFDTHQQAILNVQIRQVREVAGGIHNVVLEVIPNVDQYWKAPR